MMQWTNLPGKPGAQAQMCEKMENFTFFRWHPKSYIQVILHARRTFRMNKRAGEAHLAVRNLLQTHDGRYEGWLMLDHKNRKFGEVLVAINMEGPEVNRTPTSHLPHTNAIVVNAMQRIPHNPTGGLQQQGLPQCGMLGNGQAVGLKRGNHIVQAGYGAITSPGTSYASVPQSAPSSPNPFAAQVPQAYPMVRVSAPASNPFGVPSRTSGYYDSPPANFPVPRQNAPGVISPPFSGINVSVPYLRPQEFGVFYETH